MCDILIIIYSIAYEESINKHNFEELKENKNYNIEDIDYYFLLYNKEFIEADVFCVFNKIMNINQKEMFDFKESYFLILNNYLKINNFVRM